MTGLDVLATGPLTTVQDLGRPGHAHLGVPMSGAADRGAHRLANRLVGNTETAATLETTLGGLRVRVDDDAFVVVTGAPCAVTRGDTPMGHGAAFAVHAGDVITLGPPTVGLRSYLAVRGGIDATPVLGSRATDTLSGLGPPTVAAGHRLPVGSDAGPWPMATESFTAAAAHHGPITLAISPGPRADALIDPEALTAGIWVVDAASDRIGVRLDRDPHRSDPPSALHPASTERASEGVALGSVQVPPGGQPVLFGADHPVTGGYPVVAVLTADAIDAAAQLVAGDRVRLVPTHR
ncbi:biotin-dependent carboxyltransferase family protein [Williamsia sp. MIQD14]|uniref:5-oxoprolinase subunit C family protein n=1 Tax=Williamsia sp. MIQD14 TaxID=3425703 RepID=UPI003DA0D2F7